MKTLKRRISAVKSIQKTTGVMKLIATSKLKNTYKKIQYTKSFTEDVSKKLKKTIKENHNLNMINSNIESDYFKKNNQNKSVLIVIITSDRGLCGAFNKNIIKKSDLKINKLKEKSIDFKIIAIGSKAIDFAKKKYKDSLILSHSAVIKSNIDYMKIKKIAEDIKKIFISENFGKCKVFCTIFKSMLIQEVVSVDFLPIKKYSVKFNDNDKKLNTESEEEIVGNLKNTVNLYLNAKFYDLMINNYVSEQAARMMAMDGANRNTKTLINKLVLEYNRKRQSAITKDISEIVSSKEAMNEN